MKGLDNISADLKSHVFNSDTWWMLNKHVFQLNIKELFGTPDIDTLANRINCQVSKYYSWRQEPNTLAGAFLQT